MNLNYIIYNHIIETLQTSISFIERYIDYPSLSLSQIISFYVMDDYWRSCRDLIFKYYNFENNYFSSASSVPDYLLEEINTSHENNTEGIINYQPKKPQSYFQKNVFCGDFLEISQSNYPRHRNYSVRKVSHPEVVNKVKSETSIFISNSRRKRNIRRILNSNITRKTKYNSQHLTLTYNTEQYDFLSSSKHFDLFLKRLKYHLIKDGRYTLNRYKVINSFGEEELKEVKECDIRYFKVVELQPVSGRIHYHVLLLDFDFYPVWDYIKFDGLYFQDWFDKSGKQTKDKLIEFQSYHRKKYGFDFIGDLKEISGKGISSIWKNGFVRIKNCGNIDNVGSYFSKYITKDIPLDKSIRIYSCSQNLLRPIEIIFPWIDLKYLYDGYDIIYQKNINISSYMVNAAPYNYHQSGGNFNINIIFCRRIL